jgi:hypothetical protein
MARDHALRPGHRDGRKSIRQCRFSDLRGRPRLKNIENAVV